MVSTVTSFCSHFLKPCTSGDEPEKMVQKHPGVTLGKIRHIDYSMATPDFEVRPMNGRVMFAAKECADAAYGVVYIAPAVIALVWVRSLPDGLWWTLLLFVVTWSRLRKRLY